MHFHVTCGRRQSLAHPQATRMSELSFFFRCEFFAYDGWFFRSILQVSLAFGAFHICPSLSLLILCL